ncbi:hypothetical protein, partial [Pelotomaculum sp. FP]|uniref:hypothetical protein n=1 Tax=Pelotomaculum sp. FP TaxID=261474 RepID=UPI001960AB36
FHDLLHLHAFFSFPKRKEHPDKLFCPHDALLPCRLFAYLNDIALMGVIFLGMWLELWANC